MVYYSDGDNVEWDGKFKGRMLSSAVYVYQIRAIVNYCHESGEVYKMGDLTLIR